MCLYLSIGIRHSFILIFTLSDHLLTYAQVKRQMHQQIVLWYIFIEAACAERLKRKGALPLLKSHVAVTSNKFIISEVSYRYYLYKDIHLTCDILEKAFERRFFDSRYQKRLETRHMQKWKKNKPWIHCFKSAHEPMNVILKNITHRNY